MKLLIIVLIICLTYFCLFANSGWLAAGSLCILPLQSIWVRKRGDWPAFHCWFWILHVVRDNCWISSWQTVRYFLSFMVIFTLFGVFLIMVIYSCIKFRGRKRACVTYCITYILSCITKHSPEYKVLMIGRVLGGIATSLLFSAFESWLVAEHNKVSLISYFYIYDWLYLFPMLDH